LICVVYVRVGRREVSDSSCSRVWHMRNNSQQPTAQMYSAVQCSTVQYSADRVRVTVHTTGEVRLLRLKRRSSGRHTRDWRLRSASLLLRNASKPCAKPRTCAAVAIQW
jgi:hypothetical protein